MAEKNKPIRILEFEVKGQQLLKKPGSDFSGLVAGTEGYLGAKFHFSDDWDCCSRFAAGFTGVDGVQHAVGLDADGVCTIPKECLTGGYFEVEVAGFGNGYLFRSDSMKIKQKVNREVMSHAYYR